MTSLQDYILTFLDTLTAHIIMVAYLFAVTDERAVRSRLKKLPPLLLSPLIATLLAAGLYAADLYVIPGFGMVGYFIISAAILVMCTIWVCWAWHFGLWRAFAATCMAGIFQVASATLSMTLFRVISLHDNFEFVVLIGISLGVGIVVVLLLYRLQFGKWFCLLLYNESDLWRTALLLFAMEVVMEVFLHMANGVQSQFMGLYYLMVLVMTILMAGLVVYLARQFDTSCKLQAQQEAIARQQLYEQDLETIRQEVRTFRHDYKNLLAGLSQQARAGELEQLHAALSELDADFDRRLGEKIQASAQIGNLQIPQVRSLLLSKLAIMREKGVECRLEVYYPLKTVAMDTWDFVRCMGILIDNAVEAVEGTDQPWVEIILLAQENGVNLRVSNPWNGKVDPAHFWEEGWSTKGSGRGLGLYSYLRILERYMNISPCTSWTDGVFVQALTIGGTA